MIQDRPLRLTRGRVSGEAMPITGIARLLEAMQEDTCHLLNIVDIDSAPEVADLDPSIHERMVVSEMNNCVRQVIDSLPSDFRTALVLHDLEGMSAKEVAAICECSLSTAKIRIHRARARLKKRLERKCDFQHDDGVLRCDRKTS